jgi:chromosome segregation ATPase
MRRGRAEIAGGLALCVVLAASVAYNFRQSQQLAEAGRQAAADRESFHQLRETLRQRELQQPPLEGEPTAVTDGTRAAVANRDATIQQLNTQLSEAQGNITDLRAQLASSNDAHAKALANADERHRKEMAGLQSQIDNLKQQLASAQDDLQASRQRIAALEANNNKLAASQASSRAAADWNRTMADFQDLQHRREAYLISIMRRYRDITSQFQAMSGTLDSSRDPNPTTFSSTALTRIQDAIALADDDLRQLSELNDQMNQLQKKLVKK